MGLIETIRDVFGFGVESQVTRQASTDDLFGMSTAYITMDADLDYTPLTKSALCFSGIDSTDFTRAVEAAREIVVAGEDRTIATVSEDSHGYQWVVIEDDDFEDLVVGIHAAADEFISRGYGARILAAVFCFEKQETRAYWIYSFRRGSFYPFVPVGSRERDHGTEFKLRSVLESEIEIESDESYWYPLWPDATSGHPWQ